MEDLNVQTIAIPVEEYKELLQKQAELSLIYHKGAGGSVYDVGHFVLDLMFAVHPELITKQEDTDLRHPVQQNQEHLQEYALPLAPVFLPGFG